MVPSILSSTHHSNFRLHIIPLSQVKYLAYLSWIATEDIETQRQGLVTIRYPGAMANDTLVKIPRVEDIKVGKTMQDSFPSRFAAIHCCLPDTASFRIFRAIIVSSMNSQTILRTTFPLGSDTEIRYQLLSFGIPVEAIPLTETGTVKTKQLHRWIKKRCCK